MGLLYGEHGFLQWWAVRIPSQIVAMGKRMVFLVGDVFAIQSMVQHITEPIFQDPTWQGRLIGIAIRVSRIVIGLLGQLFAIVFTIVLLVLWYGFPLLAFRGAVL